MPLFSTQRDIFKQAGEQPSSQDTITIGQVVDTNDPQQMGRVRVVCTQWGDSLDTALEDLPWAIYCTPFGGQVSMGTRGPGIQESSGGIAYGMWAIPKLGAQVLVMCLDGDPYYRVYLGCVFDQFTPHTLPHGRFMYDDHPELEKEGGSMRPFGPFTSREDIIAPLHENLKMAFGNKDEPNYEWRSRAADYTVAGITVGQLNQTYSKVGDDKEFSFDNWSSTQGYQTSRIDPNPPDGIGKNYDSMVYSFTSPGFHSFSMDDRQENCRLRMRTTAGHQIIMDDTNERIYVATAKGNNWIEMDQDGNIDIFTTNKVNVRAEKDINFTSNETIRMYADKGIHMYTNDEIRMEAIKDIHVKTPQNIRAHAGVNIHASADANFHASAGESMYLLAAAELHAKSGANANLTGGGTVNILAGGNIIETGPTIHLNGPAATQATSASPPNELNAFWTSRVPTHEPFARTMTSGDFTHAPEFKYEDQRVNREERGRKIVRGMYYRR